MKIKFKIKGESVIFQNLEIKNIYNKIIMNKFGLRRKMREILIYSKWMSLLNVNK